MANTESLAVRILGVRVRIRCSEPESLGLLRLNFGAMASDESSERPGLEYRVDRRVPDGSYRVARGGLYHGPEEPNRLVSIGDADDCGELIYLVEKDLTVELQKLRSRLYFLHGAALEFRGRGLLLLAPSGGGKSTLTWALLHRGFRYLSDELSPVDLSTFEVHPYPHALCLKSEPPPAYPRQGGVWTERTLHIRPARGALLLAPLPLSWIVFLERRARSGPPCVRRISAGEAAARLFVQALNPLAHPENGLAGAAAVARHAARVHLTYADVGEACEIMREILERSPRPRAGGNRWQPGA